MVADRISIRETAGVFGLCRPCGLMYSCLNLVSPITRSMRAATRSSAPPCSKGFQAFWASSACAVSATSYHSCSDAPPSWPSAFSWAASVVKLGFPVLASGSNCAVKPTRLRRAAYFRSLAPLKTNLFRPCLFKRHSVSQAFFSAGFAVSPGFACWRCAGLWPFWPLVIFQ